MRPVSEETFGHLSLTRTMTSAAASILQYTGEQPGLQQAQASDSSSLAASHSLLLSATKPSIVVWLIARNNFDPKLPSKSNIRSAYPPASDSS